MLYANSILIDSKIAKPQYRYNKKTAHSYISNQNNTYLGFFLGFNI